MNEWISENKPKLDDLLAVGKRIAEAGRMELETHEALARLDDLIEIVHDVSDFVENLWLISRLINQLR